MKLFCAAIALAFASPALAQADPHAGHAPAAHQGAHQGHGEHAGHGGQHGAGHEGHEGHKDCCKDGAKMPCCEKHEARDAKPAQGHSGH